MRAYIDLVIGSDELRPFGDLPYISIKKHIFSAGEVHMTIRDLKELEGIKEVIILCHGRSHNVMEVLQINDILKRNGIKRVSLYMPYFYYSRQDRATTPESSFALKLFCQMLGSADFHYIYTHDLHSDVAMRLLEDRDGYPILTIINNQPVEFLQYIWSLKDYDYIIAPDAGAAKKIGNICDLAGIHQDKITTATKHRDPATGQLGSPSMDPLQLAGLEGKRALIFDDICDGGYTFIQLAKFIKENSKCDLDLAVTHGIFNKGIAELKRHFDKVFTTDSMPYTFGTELIKHNVRK